MSTGPDPTPDCSLDLAWRVVNSPNLVPQDSNAAASSGAIPGVGSGEQEDRSGNNLSDVAGMSADDVWAVGYRYDGASVVPLVEHWDGKAWNIAYIRNVAAGAATLTSVAALHYEVWAVGSVTNVQHVTQPLIEHWDGTQWVVIPAAQVNSSHALFNGVAILSDKDAWAVGYYGDARGIYHTMTQHWNGKEWLNVPTPNTGNTLNLLTSVAIRATDDVWAVGYYVGARNNYQTLTQHWDG